jgi:hypothetical protein
MSRAVKLRNRLNYLYWTQLCPRLPLNNVQFEQLTDFKFPQRMYLATMASFVILMVLQLAIAAQFNHVGSMIELSRPLLTAEVARVNIYALDFALVRNLVSLRLLPANTAQWSIGRPNSKNGQDAEANIDQFSEIVPFSQRCERSTPHVRSIADEAEDIGSRLTFSCLLRQFSIRVFSRDDGTSLQLSARAQERMRSATEARWSGRQINHDLTHAVFSSMTFALAASFALTFTSIVCLALGYRSDIMKARMGHFAPVGKLRNFWDLTAPTQAGMFVGSQTYGVLAGWLIYLCGSFTLSFAFSWPPLRSFLIEKCWLLFVVMLSLWLGAFIFSYVAAYASWSPIRVKEGYIKGTKLVRHRGWWSLFEFLALYIHVAASAFGTFMHLFLSFCRQFMRVSRLDIATFKGNSNVSDPGAVSCSFSSVSHTSKMAINSLYFFNLLISSHLISS